MNDPERDADRQPGGSWTAARSAGAGASRSFTVLVIDDNEGDRRLNSMCLGSAWPFERDLVVDCAADGAEAIEKLRARRFALVMLDWMMPALGGREVLRTIRGYGVRTPVVVISGLPREELGEDLESLGAGFVRKDDLNPDTLRNAIAMSMRLLHAPGGETSGPASHPAMPGRESNGQATNLGRG